MVTLTTLSTDPRKFGQPGDDADQIAAADAAAILVSARDLMAASALGLSNAGLKGKQLALMCASEFLADTGAADFRPQEIKQLELERLDVEKFEVHKPEVDKTDTESSDAAFFRLAATRLGAHVARIRPRLSASSSGLELRRLALILGRLYDAVECQGLSLDLVQKMRVQANVPIYFGLASADHPVALLAAQLTGAASPRDKRLFVLQAALLRSFA